MLRTVFLSVLVLFLVTAVVAPSHAGVYLKISDTGVFELTNSPGDATFTLITGSESGVDLDRTDRAMDVASAKHGLPKSLILAVIKNHERENGGLMGLPQPVRATITDTEVQDVQKNVLAGTKYLKEMLSRFEGNLTLALGGYYTGGDAVDEAGGLPNEDARRFVDRVRRFFAEIKDRDEIFYTYENEDGVPTVVNISPF